ncbi:kinase-like protein [Choiromyces venosus 120613-1]|uniref:Kinase-like protein n=1 Tax=Choiromyces venosus 120613-1 TaxID=1336337 RepID=A0A3N4JF50_9PEZI|nr:kinase-like protein [Choiromyces venosus 120613-1]
MPPPVHPLTLFPEARLIYNCNDGLRQIYDLGNGHLYKFRPHRDGIYESDIHALIKSTTTIPVPDIYYEWVTVEHIHHLIMEKIDGAPLDAVWGHLDTTSEESIVLQLIIYLKELRTITSSSIGSVSGGPLQDTYGFLFEGKNTSRGPFTDDQSLWLAMTSRLRGNPSRAMKQALLSLRPSMPECFPAVLTHADLHPGNILVRDGNIVAIIDWEIAGFFPIWMEYLHYLPASNGPELRFEDKVLKGMEAYPAVTQFMAVLGGLRLWDTVIA